MHRVLYLGTDPTHFVTHGEVVHYPMIKVVARDPRLPEIQEAFAQFSIYTHLIFTSKHAAQIFIQALHLLGYGLEVLQKKNIIAIGAVTASVLLKHTLTPTHVAQEETQEGIVALLSQIGTKEHVFFCPRSALARCVLDGYCSRNKIPFYPCVLYDTVACYTKPIPDLNDFDEIVFTSPSTVNVFAQIYSTIPPHIRLTPIGPITAAALYKIDSFRL